MPVCISAEVSPQIREYPRMVTTACNAATMPVIGPYLDELQKWLSAEGFGGSVLMMLSNGGVVSADDAARAPIRLVESGPAAGALAGSWFARRLGEERLLCFDMGGTTAKACLVEHGEPEPDDDVRGRPHLPLQEGLRVPGVGARRSTSSRSAPAAARSPAPTSSACSRSDRSRPAPSRARRRTAAAATEPAVTDADVVLGLLDPAAFLGGDMPLDGAAAAAALDAVGSELGLDTVQAAAGIHEIVNQNMAAAARMHAVEQGVDLRGVAVLAFGGAGPVHACGVAELLESDRVDLPGQRQRAVGVRHARVAGAHRPRPLDAAPTRRRRRRPSATRCSTSCAPRAAACSPPPGRRRDDVRFRYGLDARYTGQGNEVTVWVGEGDAWPVRRRRPSSPPSSTSTARSSA